MKNFSTLNFEGNFEGTFPKCLFIFHIKKIGHTRKRILSEPRYYYQDAIIYSHFKTSVKRTKKSLLFHPEHL